MINQDKLINSLPNANKKVDEGSNVTDHYRWINTIPKKNKYSSIKKYSIVTVLFVCGFLFVSVVICVSFFNLVIRNFSKRQLS